MAARFFLGLVESIIGPVFVIVTSNWWTRSEQAFRTAFWLGGTPVRISFSVYFVILNIKLYCAQIGNFFGGILSYGLGSSMHTYKSSYALSSANVR